MSLGVSRESISKLMTELVESFPMEGEGRSSISDLGKLLFTEGQNGNTLHLHKAKEASSDHKLSKGIVGAAQAEPTTNNPVAALTTTTATGTKRVFTEIKGVPRQKQHEVTCVITENGKIALSQSSMRKIMKSKDKAIPKRWTQEEDDMLREAVGRHGERNWKSIAEEVPGRNHTQCLQRWTKVLAPGLVKGHWRPEEDELLKELVAEGRKNWGQVAAKIPGRTSKQCRERWYNHLDPSIVRGEYSAEEDRIILEAQARLGNRWSAIAAMLPGRTEDAVKIRWKSLCRVRKGAQGRRGSGSTADKVDKQPKMVGPPPPPMHGVPMHHPHAHPAMATGPTFGSMIKTEDMSAYGASSGMHPMTGRLQVPHPAMPMHPHAMASHHPTAASPMHMGGFGGMNSHPYDPMNQFRKPPMAAAMHTGNMGYNNGSTPNALPTTQPHAGSTQEFNIDRRANVVNLSSSPANSFHRPSYGNAYGNGYNNGQMQHTPMYMQSTMYPTQQPVNPMYRPPYMASSQLQQQSFGSSSAYGYNMQSMGNNHGNIVSPMHQSASTMGVNSVAPIANTQQMNHPSQPSHTQQPQQPQQSPQHQLTHNQPQDHQHQRSAEQSEERQQQQAASSDATTPNGSKEESADQQPPAETSAPSSSEAATSKPPTAFNPAASFARSLAAKPSDANASDSKAADANHAPPRPAFPANPVAAFLQQQQKQKEHMEKNGDASSAAASDTRPPVNKGINFGMTKPNAPFNPAATFAQRFQQQQQQQVHHSQKPPMPVHTKGAEDAAERDAPEGPSLKRVKPRNSIDAARASAARRLRNSGGSAAALSGRPSLDVFLNEIGDIGRISDLKMDEFQTLDELWRVSDDMNRLSL